MTAVAILSRLLLFLCFIGTIWKGQCARKVLFERDVRVMLENGSHRTVEFRLREGETFDAAAARSCSGIFQVKCDPTQLLQELAIEIQNTLNSNQMHQPQLHDIILWGNIPRSQRNLALNELLRIGVNIRAVFEFSWNQSTLDSEFRFQQFYGSGYYYMRFRNSQLQEYYESMTTHKGSDDFLVILVLDPAPMYAVRSDVRF